MLELLLLIIPGVFSCNLYFKIKEEPINLYNFLINWCEFTTGIIFMVSLTAYLRGHGQISFNLLFATISNLLKYLLIATFYSILLPGIKMCCISLFLLARGKK